jgi:hypothetical protein
VNFLYGILRGDKGLVKRSRARCPACREPFGFSPTRHVVTQDGPCPAREVGDGHHAGVIARSHQPIFRRAICVPYGADAGGVWRSLAVTRVTVTCTATLLGAGPHEW